MSRALPPAATASQACAAAGSDQLQALQPPTCFAPSPAARALSQGRVQPPTAPARAGGPAARGPRILSDDGGRVVGADDPFQGARRRPRAGLRVAAAGRRTAADARQASRPADGGAAAAVIPSGSRKQDASAGIPFLSECIRRGARRASGIAVLERPLLERTQQSMEQKRNHHARHVWIHNRPGFRDLKQTRLQGLTTDRASGAHNRPGFRDCTKRKQTEQRQTNQPKRARTTFRRRQRAPLALHGRGAALVGAFKLLECVSMSTRHRRHDPAPIPYRASYRPHSPPPPPPPGLPHSPHPLPCRGSSISLAKIRNSPPRWHAEIPRRYRGGTKLRRPTAGASARRVRLHWLPPRRRAPR